MGRSILWRGTLRARPAPLSREADGTARPFTPEEVGRAHSDERGGQRGGYNGGALPETNLPPAAPPDCPPPPRPTPRGPRQSRGCPTERRFPPNHRRRSRGPAAGAQPSKAGVPRWAPAVADRHRGGQPATGATAALRGRGRAAPQRKRREAAGAEAAEAEAEAGAGSAARSCRLRRGEGGAGGAPGYLGVVRLPCASRLKPASGVLVEVWRLILLQPLCWRGVTVRKRA